MAAKQVERRNETIQVKVTPTERAQLERIADHAKVSLSEAGRRAIVRDLAKETNVIERGRPVQKDGE
jgi:hypothetical protein